MPKDSIDGKSITLLNRIITNEEQLQYQFLDSQTKLKLEAKQKLNALETSYKEKLSFGKESIDQECQSIKENLLVKRTKLYTEYQSKINDLKKTIHNNFDNAVNIVVKILLRS